MKKLAVILFSALAFTTQYASAVKTDFIVSTSKFEEKKLDSSIAKYRGGVPLSDKLKLQFGGIKSKQPLAVSYSFAENGRNTGMYIKVGAKPSESPSMYMTLGVTW